MTFAEKLRALRRQAGFSQEKLAEKLGVSRQAITKWETEAGLPEIENIMAVSALFGVSMDELLSNERGAEDPPGELFESVTEYDVDEPKRFDMKLGGAKKLVVSGYAGEKLRVRLASNALPALQSDLKVKIDDVRNRIDVDVLRKNGLTEAAAKEALTIFVQLPSPYIGKVELAANARTVELRSLRCDSVELDIKAREVLLEDVDGSVEIDCNLDMDVLCRSLRGELTLNQISATSRLSIPEGTAFAAAAKGPGNSISFERGGAPAEPFGTPGAGTVIELNGMKSELVISAYEEEG